MESRLRAALFLQTVQRAGRVARPYEATQEMPAFIVAGHAGPALRDFSFNGV